MSLERAENINLHGRSREATAPRTHERHAISVTPTNPRLDSVIEQNGMHPDGKTTYVWGERRRYGMSDNSNSHVSRRGKMFQPGFRGMIYSAGGYVLAGLGVIGGALTPLALGYGIGKFFRSARNAETTAGRVIWTTIGIAGTITAVAVFATLGPGAAVLSGISAAISAAAGYMMN